MAHDSLEKAETLGCKVLGRLKPFQGLKQIRLHLLA